MEPKAPEDAVKQKPSDPSRRRFFRKAADVGKAVVAHQVLSKIDTVAPVVGALTASTAVMVPQDRNFIAEKRTHPPTELPKDTLSDEELSAAHIRINQSPSVKFHLRKKALDVPVFKDAKDGKLDEVIITMMDNVTWESAENLPEDVKLIWNQLYDRQRTLPQQRMEILGKFLDSNTADRYVEAHHDELENGTFNWNEFFATAASEKDQKEMQRRKEELDYFLQIKGPPYLPKAAIEQGSWLQKADPDFLVKHPEYEKKVYLFFHYRNPSPNPYPHPSQSYPSPDMMIIAPGQSFDNDDEYIFDKKTITPGEIAHHEVGHYESPTSPPNPEGTADKRMYYGVDDAFDRLVRFGDDSRFWAVFETDEGITITQNQPTSTTTAA